jgi:16S rRNA (guanine966-N2)-methyltransferase
MRSKVKTGKIRIIAGNWRHRILSFPLEKGLRPSPDRVRETLFNWLMPFIQGAVCLDLFSGSGALGFEALSRGAKEVVMIDQNTNTVKQLKYNATLLGTENAYILQAYVPVHLPSFTPQTFDLVFLDPPFQSDLLSICCKWLEEEGLLNPSSLIYVETYHKSQLEGIPVNWEVFRSKKSGNLYYALYRKT